MGNLIGINDFVRRQTPESPFSHFIATHDAKWDVSRIRPRSLEARAGSTSTSVSWISTPARSWNPDEMPSGKSRRAFRRSRYDGEPRR